MRVLCTLVGRDLVTVVRNATVSAACTPTTRHEH